MIEKAHTWDEKKKYNRPTKQLTRYGIKHQAMLEPEIAKAPDGVMSTGNTPARRRIQVEQNDFIEKGTEDGLHRPSNNRSVS